MCSSLVTLQRGELVAASSSGIWDFSTFGPDLIVGALTALGVGLVLLWAERRLSSRARGESVAQQQERAVASGVQLLQSSLAYIGDGVAGLLPAGENLKRLQASVHSVAPDRPSRPVFGYDWLAEAVGAYEQLEVLADSIGVQVERYARSGPVLTGTALFGHIRGSARADIDAPFSWRGTSTPAVHLAQIAEHLENDYDLTGDVVTYLRARHQLEGYRSAFLDAWYDLSARSHAVNIESAKGAPFGWLKGLIVERRRLRKYEELTRAVVATTEDRLNTLRGGC